MAIDWSSISALGGIPKVRPGVLVRKEKQRANASNWRKTSKAVDKRDAVDEAPICFITGKRLQAINQLDEWTFRDRAHLEARSLAKSRRFKAVNVISCSRAVHRLIDSSALSCSTSADSQRDPFERSITSRGIGAWCREDLNPASCAKVWRFGSWQRNALRRSSADRLALRLAVGDVV